MEVRSVELPSHSLSPNALLSRVDAGTGYGTTEKIDMPEPTLAASTGGRDQKLRACGRARERG
ncbi:MAG: hypothetical protein H7226_04250 [Salinibacterium sp.]|nr:hypothetical protein [Salinibacterium sp.]